jgi:GNAT superfamily N-acetyltransferase
MKLLPESGAHFGCSQIGGKGSQSGDVQFVDDAGLVGVAVGVDGWSGDPRRRELVGMWVAPTHRRLGVARNLLAQVKAWAASEGATTLRLGVREGNEEALVAYVSMGMSPSGESMPEMGRPTKAIVVMECDLRSA